MSRIVVAIDFSDCSINAFLHALSIAQHCESDLVLVWVEKTSAENSKYASKYGVTIPEIRQAFDEMIAKYQPELLQGKITYAIRKGKIYKEVTAEAKDAKAMLTVVGTHGASGFEEFWIGSNANKIIAASGCPVITIRAGINIKRPLTRIIFPIDSAEETRQKASFTAFLARKHNAEIFILKLYTSKLKAIRQNVDLYASQVVRYFMDEQVKNQVESVETDNISRATIDYATAVDANLIAIMTEQETKMANIMLGPYAHQIVNHSPFPVLSIHARQTQQIGQGF